MVRRLVAATRGVQIALVLLLVLGAGVWLGGHGDWIPGGLRSFFVSDSDGRLVHEALDVIEHDYYRKVPREQLLGRGLKGIVASLDDQFSNYFTPREYAAFGNESNPSFSGVGITVSSDRLGLRVIGTVHGAPAARAGVRAGEIVVAVDGVSIKGRPAGYSQGLIRGRPGTVVALTLLDPNGRRRTLRITRARIEQPVATGRLRRVRGKELGYVRFTQFTDGSAGQVRGLVERDLHRGARGILLDLRGNPGGLLDQAVAVASIFIPDGTIVTVAGRTHARHTYAAAGDAIPLRIPVVVLVDRASASSAEIVTGALQDRHRATVVGTRTFGKGVFQEIRQLSNGGALDITVGEYFLPSGRNLGGGGVRAGAGIRPDVVVAPPRAGAHGDRALAVALATLAGQVR